MDIHMPRLQVYLPDDLFNELKERNLSASELLQIALRAELDRQRALDATAKYIDELAEDVGEPSNRQRTLAETIVRRIRDQSLDQTG